jgi:myosin heavy subunit
VEELRIEKSSSERLLADLQQTLRDVQQGWAQAKQRQEDLQIELQTAEQLTGDPEQVKRLLDNLDERERELQHLKTLTTCYREQITTLKADVQQKEEANVSLEEQQSVALRELEVLQKPADAVLLEAAHTAAELSLLQEKYAAEQGRAQQLAGDNKALEAKNRLLRATLAEMQSERVFDDLHKEQSLDFEEDAISCADPLTHSMSEDLRTLLGLSEEAEVCRKVSYNSREWVLVQLPRQGFCWIQLGTPNPVSREQAAYLFDEVARLLQAYELSSDVPLAVARALCLLERAQLISSPPLRPLQTSGQVSNPERLKGLVLELLRLLPNL